MTRINFGTTSNRQEECDQIRSFAFQMCGRWESPCEPERLGGFYGKGRNQAEHQTNVKRRAVVDVVPGWLSRQEEPHEQGWKNEGHEKPTQRSA